MKEAFEFVKKNIKRKLNKEIFMRKLKNLKKIKENCGMDEYRFNLNGMIEKCEVQFKKIMERHLIVIDNNSFSINYKNRLNQFLLIHSENDSLSWGFSRKYSLYLSYAFPEGTQFSWRSSNIEEIQTFTHPDDTITLNDFDDISNIIYPVYCLPFMDQNHYCDAPLSINELHKQFGNKVPDNLFGFERFEKINVFQLR